MVTIFVIYLPSCGALCNHFPLRVHYLQLFSFSPLFHSNHTTAKFTSNVLKLIFLLTALPSKLTDLLPSCLEEVKFSIQQAVFGRWWQWQCLCVCVLKTCVAAVNRPYNLIGPCRARQGNSSSISKANSSANNGDSFSASAVHPL